MRSFRSFSKRASHVAIVSVLAVAAAMLLQGRLTARSKAEWQYSVSNEVRLGIRNKSTDLEDYDAVFRVTGQDGKAVERTIEVKALQFGYARFPTDFGGWAKDGTYVWEVFVDNRKLLEGSFEYKEQHPEARSF